VRKILAVRNIMPEALPAAEDVKKVARRLKSDEKKLVQASAGKVRRKSKIKR